jgi:hypothetical protein
MPPRTTTKQDRKLQSTSKTFDKKKKNTYTTETRNKERKKDSPTALEPTRRRR